MNFIVTIKNTFSQSLQLSSTSGLPRGKAVIVAQVHLLGGQAVIVIVVPVNQECRGGCVCLASERGGGEGEHAEEASGGVLGLAYCCL